jgi:peptidoglycan hydrolase CwlO-like protein
MPDIESSGKYLKWLQSAIAVLAVIIGLGITWGITTTELATHQTQISELKETVKDERSMYKNEIDKLKAEVMELKLKDATKDQILVTIQKDLAEVGQDVKKLLRNR